MLGPCWGHVGSIFRSWAPFAALAAFVAFRARFLDVLARSGHDFERSHEGPGKVLEPLNAYFSTFLHACALKLSECSV